MKSCAFFGHSKGGYRGVEEKLREVIKVLIEQEGVFQFYLGARGAFDVLCVRILNELKQEFPIIKITKVLSYIPKVNEDSMLACFDDSIYLLERNVPPKYAIIETNLLLVKKVDFIVSGVRYTFGGAVKAVEYARKKGKIVIDIL